MLPHSSHPNQASEKESDNSLDVPKLILPLPRSWVLLVWKYAAYAFSWRTPSHVCYHMPSSSSAANSHSVYISLGLAGKKKLSIQTSPKDILPAVSDSLVNLILVLELPRSWVLLLLVWKYAAYVFPWRTASHLSCYMPSSSRGYLDLGSNDHSVYTYLWALLEKKKKFLSKHHPKTSCQQCQTVWSIQS